MNKESTSSNWQIAQQIQDKFTFYTVGLVFTVLGFSIQTSALNKSTIHAVLEIISWLCLLLSGLAGLSRLEWLPVLYRHFTFRKAEQNNLNVLEGLKAIGNDDVPLEKKGKRIKERNGEINRISKLNTIKYNVHKWGFATGFGFLFLSRIFKGLSS